MADIKFRWRNYESNVINHKIDDTKNYTDFFDIVFFNSFLFPEFDIKIDGKVALREDIESTFLMRPIWDRQRKLEIFEETFRNKHNTGFTSLTEDTHPFNHLFSNDLNAFNYKLFDCTAKNWEDIASKYTRNDDRNDAFSEIEKKYRFGETYDYLLNLETEDPDFNKNIKKYSYWNIHSYFGSAYLNGRINNSPNTNYDNDILDFNRNLNYFEMYMIVFEMIALKDNPKLGVHKGDRATSNPCFFIMYHQLSYQIQHEFIKEGEDTKSAFRFYESCVNKAIEVPVNINIEFDSNPDYGGMYIWRESRQFYEAVKNCVIVKKFDISNGGNFHYKDIENNRIIWGTFQKQWVNNNISEKIQFNDNHYYGEGYQSHGIYYYEKKERQFFYTTFLDYDYIHQNHTQQWNNEFNFLSNYIITENYDISPTKTIPKTISKFSKYFNCSQNRLINSLSYGSEQSLYFKYLIGDNELYPNITEYRIPKLYVFVNDWTKYVFKPFELLTENSADFGQFYTPYKSYNYISEKYGFENKFWQRILLPIQNVFLFDNFFKDENNYIDDDIKPELCLFQKNTELPEFTMLSTLLGFKNDEMLFFKHDMLALYSSDLFINKIDRRYFDVNPYAFLYDDFLISRDNVNVLKTSKILDFENDIKLFGFVYAPPKYVKAYVPKTKAVWEQKQSNIERKMFFENNKIITEIYIDIDNSKDNKLLIT